jgi:hypothetical protein
MSLSGYRWITIAHFLRDLEESMAVLLERAEKLLFKEDDGRVAYSRGAETLIGVAFCRAYEIAWIGRATLCETRGRSAESLLHREPIDSPIVEIIELAYSTMEALAHEFAAPPADGYQTGFDSSAIEEARCALHHVQLWKELVDPRVADVLMK